MVQNVGFRNAVGSVRSDPGHETSKVSKKIAVQRGKCTTGKVELWCTVMGKKRVGVLQESDQNQPVVNPEVRNKICSEDNKETPFVDTEADTRKPKEDTNS